MRIIETQEEFEEMLTLEKCLVFVAAEWSQPSGWAEEKLKTIERNSNLMIFQLDIDNGPCTNWLMEQAKILNNTFHLSGAGELLLVKRGVALSGIQVNCISADVIKLKLQQFFEI